MGNPSLGTPQWGAPPRPARGPGQGVNLVLPDNLKGHHTSVNPFAPQQGAHALGGQVTSPQSHRVAISAEMTICLDE